MSVPPVSLTTVLAVVGAVLLLALLASAIDFAKGWWR